MKIQNSFKAKWQKQICSFDLIFEDLRSTERKT